MTAFYIRLETKEDIEWLSNILDNSVMKVKNGNVALVDIAENILRVHDATHSAMTEDEIITYLLGRQEEIKEAKKKVVKKELPNFCEQHKTYGAVKPPRTECDVCWTQYKRFHPLEYGPALKKFQRRQEKAS